MTTFSHETKAATKLIAKAFNVADRRKIANATPDVPKREKDRQIGRYEKSIDDLCEATEELRAGSRS